MRSIRRLFCRHREAYAYGDHFDLLDYRCDKCGASWIEVMR